LRKGKSSGDVEMVKMQKRLYQITPQKKAVSPVAKPRRHRSD